MWQTFHCAAALATVMASCGFAQSAFEATVISPDFVVEGRVVKGVPYSAQAVTSVKQTLPTGSEIVTQMTALVARDAEGRTRREQTIRAIGPWAVLPPISPRGAEESWRETPTVILIQDPVKQVSYTLNPRTHLARVTHPSVAVAVRRDEGWSRPAAPERQTERSEALGNRVIERVPAQGRRTVVTLPAGSIGNSAPLELTVETWYSPDLQVVVLGKRSDPRVGEITYRLVSIKRGDPPASLFEVPADYRVEGEPRRLNEREQRKER
ncbi:conserved exported hypothetical protein [Candidatus Sulfopaludibacter sp. SbA4]|nr:conserved exported hypothetical protein [Candidatus Sulfopaludibacter sp. SbA4]